MPELPEVETIVRDLEELVVGRRIEKAVVKLPKIAPVGPRRLGRFLAGAEIESARRRGKFIILELSGDR
ncbi:MAG: DNA-formamidopyrimidine glycosylase family protein, partial [Thermodesulfobacteriota bacterium]